MEWGELLKVNNPIAKMGLGCWVLGGHGWGSISTVKSNAAVRKAYEQGVLLYDTADCYGLGVSEKTLQEVLGSDRKKVCITTKGGVRWDNHGRLWNDISPSYLKTAIEASLRRLQIEQIPLYYLHKPDGKTPIQKTITFLLEQKQMGKIGGIGLSNFSAMDIQKACDVAPIDVVQERINLLDLSQYHKIVQCCKNNCITIVSSGTMAEGLLTGKFNENTVFPETDHRSKSANFKGSRFAKNLQIVKALSDEADKHGVSQLSIALLYVLQLDSIGFILCGAKSPEQVLQNISALDPKNRLDMRIIDKILRPFSR